MDQPTLSGRELWILAGIEERLRVDTELDRRMRTMRLHRLWHLWQFVRSERELFGVALFGTAAVLLVVGVPAVRFTPALLISGLILLVLAAAAGMIPPLTASLRRRRPAGASRSSGSVRKTA